jgi:hypothetical protein
MTAQAIRKRGPCVRIAKTMAAERRISTETAAIRELRMPMESRPRTTQAMRITRRSLEPPSVVVGIRAKIRDRTVMATTMAVLSDGGAEGA